MVSRVHCHEDIESVNNAVQICSASVYTLFGEVRDISRLSSLPRPGDVVDLTPNAELRSADDVDRDPAILQAILQSEIYTNLYRRPNNHRARSSFPIQPRDFLNQLSAANAGTGGWDPGWKVVSFESDGSVAVAKNNVTFWAQRREIRIATHQQAANNTCDIWVGKEFRNFFPGYYVANGTANTPHLEAERSCKVRLYWNLSSAAAGPYIQHITRALDSARVPFRTKVVSSPEGYVNADAGVLYIERNDYARARDQILRVYEEIRNILNPEVPMFTKRLGDGLGIAEDPGSELSFGQARCRTIAKGLWAAFQEGIRGRDAQLKRLVASFREEGLDAAAPFLEAGSADIYEVPSEPAGSGLGTRRPGIQDGARLSATHASLPTRSHYRVKPNDTHTNCITTSGASAVHRNVDKADKAPIPHCDTSMSVPPSHLESGRFFLDAAAQIGESLVAAAIWDEHQEQCNWMGRRDIVDDPLTERFSRRTAALTQELYGGSCGVALFLAEVSHLTDSAAISRTATAALRRSVQYLRRRPSLASPLSYFAGHLGIAATLIRAREVGLDCDWQSETSWLLECIQKAIHEPRTLDVVTGNAGAIPILLRLSRNDGFGDCKELAIALGNELCRAARRENSLCFWESGKASGASFTAPPMTGFSHGASGMALSLLELFACTGESDFRDVAREAFAYEDSLFSATAGNWIDTRQSYSREDGQLMGRFQTGWCHGAPGIALARARAVHLDVARASDHRRMVAIAVETTKSAIQERLKQPGYDATLCHGLGGLSEILLTCGGLLGNAEWISAARDTSERLIDLYGLSGDWPSGINAGGPNPSLMVGSSGIGYHFLRVHAQEQVIPILLSLP
jgi:hypothetical protein